MFMDSIACSCSRMKATSLRAPCTSRLGSSASAISACSSASPACEVRAMTIRVMQPGDAAAVAALTTQLGYPALESDILRRYNLMKDRSDARLFVAEAQDSAIVGWIHMQVTYLLESDPRAEIWGLVVGETARGS